MPPSRAIKGAHAPFTPSHASLYGLKVMERCPNTSRVISVRCQFCIYFGVEIDNSKPRERGARNTNKAWTGMFRSDLYRHHNASQHPTKWIAYEACSCDEKTRFFDGLIPQANTMLAHIHSGQDAIPLEFAIRLPIIDTLIGDMFFHPDDQG